MATAPEKSDETREKYGLIARAFVAQFVHETRAEGWTEYAEKSAAAAYWFLGEGGNRWSAGYVRLLSAALTDLIRDHRDWGLTPAHTADELLHRLKHDRPAAKPRRPTRKSASTADIRRLVRHLRCDSDQFGRWIAGYVQIASRIGWRPVEILSAFMDGSLLQAPAAKHTNGRGLCDTCEVDLVEYGTAQLLNLSRWLSESAQWIDHYGGRKNLAEIISKRINDACERLNIRPMSIYLFRHVAISDLKRSGFSKAEIAVLINHRSTRTASERYGKRRSGSRRAKKRFVLSPLRLALVNQNAREFRPLAQPKPTS